MLAMGLIRAKRTNRLELLRCVLSLLCCIQSVREHFSSLNSPSGETRNEPMHINFASRISFQVRLHGFYGAFRMHKHGRCVINSFKNNLRNSQLRVLLAIAIPLFTRINDQSNPLCKKESCEKDSESKKSRKSFFFTISWRSCAFPIGSAPKICFGILSEET